MVARSPVRRGHYHLFSIATRIAPGSAKYSSIAVSSGIATNSTAGRDTIAIVGEPIIVGGIIAECVITWLVGVSCWSSVDDGAWSLNADCSDTRSVSQLWISVHDGPPRRKVYRLTASHAPSSGCENGRGSGSGVFVSPVFRQSNFL